MARPLRMEFEGALYHVMARGIERRNLFMQERDHARFLSDLFAVRAKYGLVVHAYCLMTNHYHLMIETPRANLSRSMQALQTRYTVWFNRGHRRVGHLFSGRYKAILVEKEAYGLELSRYIHLNPLRAGLCDKPEAYSYSSLCHFISRTVPGDIPLDREWTLGQFHRSERRAQGFYRRFVADGMEGAGRDLASEVRAGGVLGGEAFWERVGRMVDGRYAGKDLDVPEARAIRGRGWGVKEIVPVVAEVWRIPVEAVRRRDGEQPARAVAMYLATRRGTETYGEIGRALDGVQYSAVAKAADRMKGRLERDLALRSVVNACERRLDESKVKL